MVLSALAWELSKEMALNAKIILKNYYLHFEIWLEKKQKKEVTHLNFLDWIRDFLHHWKAPFSHRFYSWKFFLRRFQKDLNQLALFDWRKNKVIL